MRLVQSRIQATGRGRPVDESCQPTIGDKGAGLRLPLVRVTNLSRLVLGGLGLSLSVVSLAAEPIRIHPENPKYFLFRGKPLVLLTATEHYGSVVNRPFDFRKYLADAADKKITLTRTFVLFRELQSARNPYSPMKPESPDYIAPYPRTGPGKALDGEPIYDLDEWNPEFFERLDSFLREASASGVVVELTLFSNTYGDSIWALNPLRAANNKQGVGDVAWQDYVSLRDRDLVERQLALARKVVRETHRYDNLYYEICNEPGGGWAGHATLEEIDAWQEAIGNAVREELDRVGAKHLIAAQEAFTYKPKFEFPYRKSYQWPLIQIVNVHPLPNTTYGGRSFQLGNFMSKELMLSEVKDFCIATYGEPRPTVLDEDNAATMYRDMTGWTIHRKRAWTSLLNGAHYDFIDFSVVVGRETGTVESNAKIRTWIRHLSEFIHSFDFVRARPLPDWLQHDMDMVVTSTMAVEGKDYICYLADAREVTDTSVGEPIAGSVTFELPAGRYRLRLYSPTSGLYSPARALEGGGENTVQLEPYQEDLVIRITNAEL